MAAPWRCGFVLAEAVSRSTTFARQHLYFGRCLSSKIHNPEYEDSDINPKRDVSNLKPHLRARMEHALRMQRYVKTNPKYPRKFFVGDPFRYLRNRDRRMYAKFGRDSGLDAGLAWPTKEELQELKYEEQFLDPSLEQVLEVHRKEADTKKHAIEERMSLIEERMAMMPKYIADYEKLKKKREDQKHAQAAKQQELLDEAREYFGYAIDKQDLRYQQMVEAKEAAEIEKQKKAKKAKKAGAFQLKIEAIAAVAKEAEEKSAGEKSSS